MIVCGGDPVSKYLRTLEPLLELVFVDDDTILSQALIDAINFKRGGYHLLVHADQIESRREQLAGLSPSSSVFLVDDFQTIPDHLPGNNVLLIGSSKRLRALSAGRLQRLLDRPSTDVAILPQFPHAQELLGQSIAAYLTAGSRKPTTSTSETS